MDQKLLLTMSQILQSHTDRVDRGMVLSTVGLLDCLVSAKDVDVSLLYDQGLIDILVSVFVDVASAQNEENFTGNDPSVALLLPLFDALNNTLKFVSREVRKALQAKTEARPDNEAQTQLAEKLLVESKPLVDMTGLLINFLCHEDLDVRDSSCRCLYLMVELFGGIYEDSLSAENMECFAEALSAADVKKQKQLLRIIKRLVSPNIQSNYLEGNSLQRLIHVLQGLPTSTDPSSAEGSAVESLVGEILLKFGHDN